MNQQKGIFRKIVAGSNAVGALWTCVLMFLITADVLSRLVLHKPMVGTPEIVANSLVAIAFLHFTYVLQEDRHVRATVLYDKLPLKGRCVLDLICDLIGVALFIAILFPSVKLLISAIEIGEFEGEGALRVPTSPVRAIVVYGSILMLIEYVIKFVGRCKALMGKQTKSSDTAESN